MDGLIEEAARLGLRWGRADGVLVSPDAFVAEAREWVDTPFMHQHEVKGHGVDCGGLVRGVSVALGLIPAEYQVLIPSQVRGYKRGPDGDQGKLLCDHYWYPIAFDDLQPGCVVLATWTIWPSHSAVVGDYCHGGLSLIHALGPRHPAKVVEHRIDNTWRRRFVAAYAIPGVGRAPKGAT